VLSIGKNKKIMTWTTDIDTTNLERVERPAPRVLPPLDQPLKSPYYVAQVPTTAIVNPDAVRNFHAPTIPYYRITPPQPLSLAGAGSNATPTAATSSFNILQPPAPTISQSLISIPTGYQFSFFQVQLPLGSRTTISTYKVYRSTTSVNTNAQVIQTISHNPANAGVPISVQDSQSNGVTQFYWVSAVSTAGLESTMTPAQAQGVTNNAGFDVNSRLASSFHNTAVNVGCAPTSTSTLSNNGSIFDIVVAASTNLFAPGGISYNSGTIGLPSFGTWWIYADDPLFQGGAVIYQATSLAPYGQVAAEGRLPWGKIHTALSGGSTGGGYSGGSTGTGAGGGRGYIQ
jgi:hypothetical protein